MNAIDIIKCEEALRVLAEHLDRELDERRDAQLQLHLESCRSCYSRGEFERRLKAQIRAVGAADVPDDVTARIERLLGTFAAT